MALPDLFLELRDFRIQNDVYFAADSHEVKDGCIAGGKHRLLRFTTRIHNKGSGDLFLGNPSGNPLFELSHSHGHYHLKDFLDYKLFDVYGRVLITGKKRAFCLMDSSPLRSGTPGRGYTCDNQGISAGWYDDYNWQLACQFIEFDSLVDDRFILEATVNPNRIVEESSYTTNTRYTWLWVEGTNVRASIDPGQGILDEDRYVNVPIPTWAQTPKWKQEPLPQSKTPPIEGLVKVTLEDRVTGRNLQFYDEYNHRWMNADEFSNYIKRGEYPNYYVRNVKGRQIPSSRPNRSIEDNLG